MKGSVPQKVITEPLYDHSRGCQSVTDYFLRNYWSKKVEIYYTYLQSWVFSTIKQLIGVGPSNFIFNYLIFLLMLLNGFQ